MAMNQDLNVELRQSGNPLLAQGADHIFRRETALDGSFVPLSPIGRTAAYAFLQRIFQGLLMEGRPAMAHLWGPVGCGKTMLAKRFAADLQQAAVIQQRKVLVVYVNARNLTSFSTVLGRIHRAVRGEFEPRGWSGPQMVDQLRRFLAVKKVHLFLILDEASKVAGLDGNSLGYELSRFNEDESTDHDLSVILTSECAIRFHMDKASQSTFPASQVYKLPPYTPREMEDLLAARAQEAFRSGACPTSLIQAAAQAAVSNSDVRVGLNILLCAGQRARMRGDSWVTREDIMDSLANHTGSHSVDDLLQLQPQQRIVLEALAQAFEGAPLTTSKSEAAYRAMCATRGVKPVKHTQFWKHLRTLKDARLIDSQKSGKGQVGTTQLITLPETTLSLLATA